MTITFPLLSCSKMEYHLYIGSMSEKEMVAKCTFLWNKLMSIFSQLLDMPYGYRLVIGIKLFF